MQTVEEFMGQLFRERTAEIRKELKRIAVFRRKFYSDACLWDSRSGAVERSDSERIENIWESNAEVRVITHESGLSPRVCYHLKKNGESWLIHDVSSECLNCRGKLGITSCFACMGKGWLHQEDVLEALKRMEKPDRGTTAED
jgi:hypothetical protein